MQYQPFEFFCSGNCRGYSVVQLDPEVEMDVIFKCPGCGHDHYRKQRGGKITEDRHSCTRDTETVHLVELPSAAFSKEPLLVKKKKELPYLGGVLSRIGKPKRPH